MGLRRVLGLYSIKMSNVTFFQKNVTFVVLKVMGESVFLKKFRFRSVKIGYYCPA